MGALSRVPVRQAMMSEHPWSTYCVPGSLFRCAQGGCKDSQLQENETEQLRDVLRVHNEN